MPDPASTDQPPATIADVPDATDDAIAVRAPTQEVVLVQLAARWAESFGGQPAESRLSRFERFRAAYAYLDAVARGRMPPDPDAPDQPATGRS